MNYYQVLDIPPDASPEDIKRAYRRLARKHHPDVAGAESGDRFHQVQSAYEILSDPGERRKYDLSVGWGRSPRTAIPYRPARAQAATVSQPATVKPTNYKPPKQTVRHSPPSAPPLQPPLGPLLPIAPIAPIEPLHQPIPSPTLLPVMPLRRMVAVAAEIGSNPPAGMETAIPLMAGPTPPLNPVLPVQILPNAVNLLPPLPEHNRRV